MVPSDCWARTWRWKSSALLISVSAWCLCAFVYYIATSSVRLKHIKIVFRASDDNWRPSDDAQFAKVENYTRHTVARLR